MTCLQYGFCVDYVFSVATRSTSYTFSLHVALPIYKDFNTANAGGSAGDLAEATNGTLFLALKGPAVDAACNTFVGIGLDIGTVFLTGFESGLFDVDTSAGGIANALYDANLVPAVFG